MMENLLIENVLYSDENHNMNSYVDNNNYNSDLHADNIDNITNDDVLIKVTNYERANKNGLEINDHILSYLKLDQFKILQKSLDKKLSQYTYNERISKLEELRDAHAEIRHAEYNNSDGTVTLIRDARAASKLYDYTMKRMLAVSNIMHIVEIAETALEAYKIQNTIDRFNISHKEKEIFFQKNLEKIIDDAFLSYEHHVDINVYRYDRKILDLAINAGLRDAEGKIKDGLAFRNLYNDQRHVITITKSDDVEKYNHAVIEADIMLLGLTTNQMGDYHNIKHYMSTALSGDIGFAGEYEMIKHNMPEWYNALSPYKRMLVYNNLNGLLAGKVIPTQLKEVLPGIRNAHVKNTMYFNGEDINLLQSSVHLGTLSFHSDAGDDQNIDVVTENIIQLQSFFPKDVIVSDVALFSPVILTEEKKMDKQIVESMKRHYNDKFSYSIMPLNGKRVLFIDNYDEGYNQAFEEIAKAMDGYAPQYLVNFIKTNDLKYIHQALKNKHLNSMTNKECVAMLIYNIGFLDDNLSDFAKSAISQIIAARTMLDYEYHHNNNLELTSLMKRISSDIHNKHGALGKFFMDLDRSHIPYFASHCKSGKDRGGLLEFEITKDALYHYYIGKDEINVNGIYSYANNQKLSENSKGDDRKAISIARGLAYGGHTQFMSSINGGSRGAHGIKDAAKSVVKYDKEVSRALFLESSNNNKIFDSVE